LNKMSVNLGNLGFEVERQIGTDSQDFWGKLRSVLAERLVFTCFN